MNNLIETVNKFTTSKATTPAESSAYGLAMVSAAIAILGTSVASVAQGLGVAKAVDAVGRNPEAMNKVRSIMIIGLSIVETGSIYCFLIALILIFA
ncbi:ATP synthase subunit C [Metamycoplasma hyosynoviae]|uniref:ATP synthase subunit C n=1 Tax=Metamycoplasma hyosynoviae TaxID=29559 RepID=UPI00049FDBBD|nr:ATP synthase subunit C [Metamycoplasma hyosynoviae]KDE45252.1 ATP synthase subunit C [Metamycoplasma hyosynoviae]